MSGSCTFPASTNAGLGTQSHKASPTLSSRKIRPRHEDLRPHHVALSCRKGPKSSLVKQNPVIILCITLITQSEDFLVTSPRHQGPIFRILPDISDRPRSPQPLRSTNRVKHIRGMRRSLIHAGLQHAAGIVISLQTRIASLDLLFVCPSRPPRLITRDPCAAPRQILVGLRVVSRCALRPRGPPVVHPRSGGLVEVAESLLLEDGPELRGGCFVVFGQEFAGGGGCDGWCDELEVLGPVDPADCGRHCELTAMLMASRGGTLSI